MRITQKKFAEHLSITQPHLNNILTKKRKTPWPIAKKLAKITGVDPAVWMEQESSEFDLAVTRVRNLSKLADIAGMTATQLLDAMEKNTPIQAHQWQRITAATGTSPEMWENVPAHQALLDLESEIPEL